MALNKNALAVEVTSGVGVTEVPEDVSDYLEAAYVTLANLPVNRQINEDFDSKAEAQLFAKQAKAWSLARGLTFARKGDIKGMPTRVSYRIYVPRSEKGETE